MVPLTVCARRGAGLTHQHIAASAKPINITTRELLLPMVLPPFLFSWSGFIRLLWTNPKSVSPEGQIASQREMVVNGAWARGLGTGLGHGAWALVVMVE